MRSSTNRARRCGPRSSAGARRLDAAFDANGVETLKASYDHLAPTGRLVVYGFHTMLPKSGKLNWAKLAVDWLRTPRFNPLNMTRDNKSVLAANLSFLQSHAPSLREGMLWLLERFESGELRPLPVETWPLRDAAGAQQRIESGQTIGKLALIPQARRRPTIEDKTMNETGKISYVELPARNIKATKTFYSAHSAGVDYGPEQGTSEQPCAERAFQSEKPQIVWGEPSDSSHSYGRGPSQRARCGFSGSLS